MKKLLTCVLMGLVATTAWAVPARQETFTHRQKDGSELTLRLVGDEFCHYYINVATGEKLERGADGEFTLIPATKLTERMSKAEARRATANKQRMARLPRMRQNADPNDANRAIGSYSNMTGTKKGIVILVNFKDVEFKTDNNLTAFYNQFNQEGYNKNSHIGSVKDYFSAQSYGNFTVDFDVVGPYTVSQNMAYYGANGSDGSDVHPAEMVIEAIKLADKDGVDFSQYDWGGDGYVDQVFVIYAGYAEAQGGAANTIWPHEWTLDSAKSYGDGTGKQRIDGKYINTYACTAELCGSSGSTMDGIGTACHEFSHCLGYPDLYDTSGGNCWGMDTFDLMDYGSYSGPNGHGEVPCGYSAYERWMAGWLTPTELTQNSNVTISNMAALNDQPEAYIIYNPKTSNEYLLLENRQSNKWFKYLRDGTGGHGLLITHVDYNSSAWTQNSVNTNSTHERFKYIAADNAYSSSTLAKDYFGSVSKVTSLTATSHSSVGGKWFNGTTKSFSGMDIKNITESSGKISFDFNEGNHDDGSRYTITYWINGEKSEWTQTSFQQSTIVKTIPNEFTNWYPMGWSRTDYTGIVPASGVLFVDDMIEGEEYTPTENITVYAVYTDSEADYCTSHPIEADYSITLMVKGSTYYTFTQNENARSFTLPEVTSDVTGWTFVGWTTASVDYTSSRPELIAAGTSVLPTADITYYAVFSSVAGGESGANLFHLVDAPEADADYVIVSANAQGTAYALDVTNISTIAAKEVGGASVSIGDGETITNPGEEIVWKATYTNNKLRFSNGENYLCVNGNGYSLKSSASDLYWSNTSGLYGKSGSGSTSYYVYADGSTFKTKTSAGNRVYLYAGSAAVTYYDSNPQPGEPDVPGGGTADPQFYIPHIAHLDKAFAAPRFNTNSEGALQYTSSDPAVATVDATTGKVTIMSIGTTIITVTQAATATHNATSDSYMIKVVN